MNTKALREAGKKYEKITKTLIERQLTVTTMESCTSGLIASFITDTEGSSAVLKGAFVTYSNERKIASGVPKEVIAAYGVYSAETAEAMAKACRAACHADIGIGITGSFGNADPGNPDSVPGSAHLCIETVNGAKVWHLQMPAQKCRFDFKVWAASFTADRLLELPALS